jgi:hypothetical protein
VVSKTMPGWEYRETPPTLGKGSLGSLEAGHEVVPPALGEHKDVTPVLGARDAPGVEHKGPPPILDVKRGDALAVTLEEDTPGLEAVRHGVAAPVVDVVDQRDLAGKISSNDELEIGLGPYEVFVTSPLLQNETGIGLIDTGAQVSLVRKKSLRENVPKAKFREINVNIQGINEGNMHIKEGIMLQINDRRKMLFYIVDSLPRGLDLILSQEWLLQNDYDDLF